MVKVHGVLSIQTVSRNCSASAAEFNDGTRVSQ